MAEYAVFDIETTGFQSTPDSLVEVAVVHVDAAGRITGSWDTLLQPSGSVGPTHVHGVTQAMVREAPRFADVARPLHALFAGRVAVAHNLRSFDGRFMAAHFASAGIDGSAISEGICTLALARRTLPGPSYKLEDCCRALGVPLDGAHQALADATATAHMFARMLPHAPSAGGRPVPPAVHVPAARDAARADVVAWLTERVGAQAAQTAAAQAVSDFAVDTSVFYPRSRVAARRG